MEKVFYHSLHVRLWTWLAENPGKEKFDWPGWKFNGGDTKEVNNHCFACEYVSYSEQGCDICPLDFNDNGRCLGGLYGNWNLARKPEELTALALQIANLPVKPGVITK